MSPSHYILVSPLLLFFLSKRKKSCCYTEQLTLWAIFLGSPKFSSLFFFLLILHIRAHTQSHTITQPSFLLLKLPCLLLSRPPIFFLPSLSQQYPSQKGTPPWQLHGLYGKVGATCLTTHTWLGGTGVRAWVVVIFMPGSKGAKSIK